MKTFVKEYRIPPEARRLVMREVYLLIGRFNSRKVGRQRRGCLQINRIDVVNEFSNGRSALVRIHFAVNARRFIRVAAKWGRYKTALRDVIDFAPFMRLLAKHRLRRSMPQMPTDWDEDDAEAERLRIENEIERAEYLADLKQSREA